MFPWQCSSDRAALSLPTFGAEFDLARPWLGLHNFAFDAQPCPSLRLLRILSNPGADTESIIDQYVRNEDLVVSYAQTEQRPVSLHTYWRALVDTIDDIKITGVDLIVSMQTDRLDSDPRLQVVSDAPPGDLICGDGDSSPILLRPIDCALSIFLAVHPRDCEAMNAAPGESGASEVAFHLFRPGLEKGVIRRARLRAAILPRDGDHRVAAECLASFLAAELPLTT